MIGIVASQYLDSNRISDAAGTQQSRHIWRYNQIRGRASAYFPASQSRDRLKIE
jgi:hypothetical protein